MNVLAIDTSTKACVLALAKNVKLRPAEPRAVISDQAFYEDAEIVERTHSKVILPRVARLLSKAKLVNSDLDLVVFGRGPGSFTGLRIGIGVVQGLAFGLDIPVVGVSSMAILAQNIFRNHGYEHSIVALTARKQEVYFGSYSIQNGIAVINGIERVVEASEAPAQALTKSWAGTGSGWQLTDELQQATGINLGDVYLDLLPSGLDLIHLGIDRFNRGLAISAEDARPEYLREQVAQKSSR